MAKRRKRSQNKRKGRRKRSAQAHAAAVLTRRLGSAQRFRPFVQRLEDLERQRKTEIQALQSDTIFLDKTAELQRRLERLYRRNKESIEAFFESFRAIGAHNFQKATRFLEDLPERTQAVLKEYIEYVSRFRAYFALRDGQFEVRHLPPRGWKFHAEIRNGRLAPPHGDWVLEDFESLQLDVPDEAAALLESGEARFVQLDDAAGQSVLNDVERTAYHADGVTIIRHNAERPYLHLMIGEKIPKELLDRLGKSITAFQRTHYGRATAGRPRNIAKAKATADLLAAAPPGTSMKEIASTVAGDTKLESAQSYVSRTKSNRP